MVMGDVGDDGVAMAIIGNANANANVNNKGQPPTSDSEGGDTNLLGSFVSRMTRFVC